MLIQGNITRVQGNEITLKVMDERLMPQVLRYLEGKQRAVEIRLNDGRSITIEQRGKYFATINDIADYTGDVTERLHGYFKDIYCYRFGEDKISMKNCSVTEARELINIVLDFVIMNDIPLTGHAVERTDDIDRFLYQCLVNRKCVCCGGVAQIHHVTGYKVGMGLNRTKVNHVGRKVIALCGIHHDEAHRDEKKFFKDRKIYGIKLNKYTAKKLGL